MSEDNYISRKQQLLKDFDKSIARIKSVLTSRYGNEQANSLISESRFEYETIIPQIPFIGHRSHFLAFLIPQTRALAIYKVLRRKGLTFEEAGHISFQMCKAQMESRPPFLRHIIGYLWFSPLFKWQSRKLAKESQKRKYPGSYVFDFIEGDNQTFDYGFDYLECGACKFLNQQGAPELAPLLCAVDIVGSEIYGWGLTRTMTIADGHIKCDFRYKKGGKTNITISPSVKDACNINEG
ncbi:MAG: L-2-amino-thiazoline-4-carboxylic acid hydrolase [Anaerolineales bacterium]|nr:L-2-amino-thiazoline-4-carboxylic acid hydrolase [Chloroflexota bacterium]MBL6981531.1 L-2-amino-thiazoline-4-carboxylic acid hydrolase [Anaerolineales bacterium]